jgi:hypothetical protein
LILACLRSVRFSPSMNHHNSSLRMAHEYAASEEAFQKATQIMCREVSIPVSDRYNAKYGETDLHNSLIALSMENRFAESGMRRLSMEASSRDVPSGSWVRDVVGRVPEREMEEKLGRALSSTLQQVRSFKVLNEPVVAAVDKHQIPRHDEGIEAFLTRGKKKAGTTKFETYATLHCVEEGRRAQVACEHVDFFDQNAETVEKLVTQARLEGVRISLLLADREFSTSPVMNGLKRLRQTFLMPCRLTPRMKLALVEHDQGKRGRISEFVVGENTAGSEPCSFTLVIFPRRGSENEKDPLKKYIPFATNMPRGKILWNLRRLPEDYRRRWGIESGYAGVEQLRARTTSRNHALRLTYFFYSLILYNAWLLANLTMARRFGRLPLARPMIPVQVIKAVFGRMIREGFGSGG